MDIVKGEGIVFDLSEIRRINVVNGGGAIYWDADFQGMIRTNQYGGEWARFFPKAEIIKEGNAPKKVRFSYIECNNAKEAISRSRGINEGGEGKAGIRRSELEAFFKAIEDLQKLENTATEPDKKSFISNLRLPDPNISPEKYRIYIGGDGKEHLAVLWGYEHLAEHDCIDTHPLDDFKRKFLKFVLPDTVDKLKFIHKVILGVTALLVAIIIIVLIAKAFSRKEPKKPIIVEPIEETTTDGGNGQGGFKGTGSNGTVISGGDAADGAITAAAETEQAADDAEQAKEKAQKASTAEEAQKEAEKAETAAQRAKTKATEADKKADEAKAEEEQAGSEVEEAEKRLAQAKKEEQKATAEREKAEAETKKSEDEAQKADAKAQQASEDEKASAEKQKIEKAQTASENKKTEETKKAEEKKKSEEVKSAEEALKNAQKKKESKTKKAKEAKEAAEKAKKEAEKANKSAQEAKKAAETKIAKKENQSVSSEDNEDAKKADKEKVVDKAEKTEDAKKTEKSTETKKDEADNNDKKRNVDKATELLGNKNDVHLKKAKQEQYKDKVRITLELEGIEDVENAEIVEIKIDKIKPVRKQGGIAIFDLDKKDKDYEVKAKVKYSKGQQTHTLEIIDILHLQIDATATLGPAD